MLIKRLLYTLTFLLALLAPLACTTAQAEDPLIEDSSAPDAQVTSVTLAWNPNPEDDIAGYNLYYGRASGQYSRFATVTGTIATIGIRGNRTTYFAVSAFNADGVESDLSDEVQWP